MLLAMNNNLPDLHYKTAEQRFHFFQELAQRVNALPGEQSVAFANGFPLRGGWGTGITIDGVGETNLSPDSQADSTGYFETLVCRYFAAVC